MANYNKTELYFFKFPNTFFDKDEIEYLEEQPDGASIIILYLKLITLATNKNGYLCRIISGEMLPYTMEDLQKRTETPVDDFGRRFKALIDVGLIEFKDNMFFIEEALNYTNQTVGALKKQEQRRRKDNCPPECPPDIEIEKEEEIEIRDKKKDKREKSIEKEMEIEEEEETDYTNVDSLLNYYSQ